MIPRKRMRLNHSYRDRFRSFHALPIPVGETPLEESRSLHSGSGLR